VRIAKHPTLLQDIIEKLLDPNLETAMRACNRVWGATFEDDFGSLLQFVSTLLLYPDHLPNPVHPRINELVPRLQNWKRTYRGSTVKTISRASERLVTQIQGMDPTMIAGMRKFQKETLVCGSVGCGNQSDLTVCGTCKIQRYCSKEHQKKDWKYHKHICNKGLEETTG